MNDHLSRRDILGGVGAAATAGILASILPNEAFAAAPVQGEFSLLKLPALPYAENALEPFIDKETVQLHHSKHFAGYVKGLNQTLEKLTEARRSKNFASVKALSRDLAFHGSGVVLHWLYFASMGPKAGGEAQGPLAQVIIKDFGSFADFWGQFAAAAKDVEGSGWAILGWEPLGRQLLVLQAEKHQDLTLWGVTPLLACDVWEHAYYLKYQNRRADYVDAFAQVINWRHVEERFAKATR